eukprot:TRINITY_DN988_c0_g1_i1.p1 TRINITY_DN988_c0_g1~~TRINITY_DN988_c0_g1_i1.p1  ORF type:complete len:180 (-),score=37.33 TRINITY_DN988_c0_g1_i1:6-545(-)
MNGGMDEQMQRNDDEDLTSYPTMSREEAILYASQNIKNRAISSQAETLNELKQRSNELQQLLSQLDQHYQNIPLSRTLLVVFSILIDSKVDTSYEYARNTIALSADMLLARLQSFDSENVPQNIFHALKNYFPSESLDAPSVFPDFEPEKIKSNLGDIGLLLYDWVDSVFTLLQLKFED